MNCHISNSYGGCCASVIYRSCWQSASREITYCHIVEAFLKNAHSGEKSIEFSILIYYGMVDEVANPHEPWSGTQQSCYWIDTTRIAEYEMNVRWSFYWMHWTAGVRSGRGGNPVRPKLCWCTTRSIGAELLAFVNSFTLCFNKSTCSIIYYFLKWTITLHRRVDSQPHVQSPIHVQIAPKIKKSCALTCSSRFSLQEIFIFRKYMLVYCILTNYSYVVKPLATKSYNFKKSD